LVSICPSAVYPELVEGLQGYSTAVRSGKALLANLSNSHFARLGLPNPSQTSGFDNPEGAIPAKSDDSTAIMRIAVQTLAVLRRVDISGIL
jgi:hypothetical protein